MPMYTYRVQFLLDDVPKVTDVTHKNNDPEEIKDILALMFWVDRERIVVKRVWR